MLYVREYEIVLYFLLGIAVLFYCVFHDICNAGFSSEGAVLYIEQNSFSVRHIKVAIAFGNDPVRGKNTIVF